ncbi:peroxidase 21 isoform X2 [Physcomitrium patens]|nr:peroxidase 21-like isoform X2 [Physcomitrium patens]PNR39444.1 hypothetical protein PHYPA_019722 [Physcomitrium patens]|eukprot:XP_024395981.1 peroxidase 21-like isoform X2 [Physcomitrella patens]
MDRLAALLIALFCLLATVLKVESEGLVYDYYANSCPNAEKIIHDTVYKLYEKKGNIATSLIRYVFHDCFDSCDASVLLESSKGVPAEKESHSQVGMRNGKWINNIKKAVEDSCPGVVSCADVLALGGAAGAQVLGGPAIKLKTGRKDSRVSLKSVADTGIPTPQSNVSFVLDYFSKMGINTEETVALLGAHTIGRAHCVSFEERIYPTVDPKMDPVFASMLKYRCPQQKTGAEPVHFTYFRNDEQSPMAFDNHYYVNLMANQGLLHIDSEIAWDSRTKLFVVEYAKDNALWHKNFATAFTKLSEHNPLTGTQGEVRKHCSYTL